MGRLVCYYEQLIGGKVGKWVGYNEQLIGGKIWYGWLWVLAILWNGIIIFLLSSGFLTRGIADVLAETHYL